MTLNQPTPAFGGEWFSKATELLGSTDKNLDQVKKSVQADLDKLKKSTDTAASLYVSAEAGFKKDLDEVGIRDDAQKEYLALFRAEWNKQEMGKRSSEILASPELAAMDGFITNVQNLPKLKAVIDSAEPGSNWQNLIKSFASRIPGLKQFLDSGGFDTILTSLGLDFLVKPKKATAKTVAAKPEEKKDEGKKEEKKPDTADASTEAVPESFKPGRTLIMGDSNFNVFPAAPHKALRERLNIRGAMTKGAMQSGWGLSEVKSKPKEFFKDFENVVIGFGTNDLGSADTAEKILGRLKEIAQNIKEKNPNIKVFIATIPPGKGNDSGQWLSNFGPADKEGTVEYRRLKLNDAIRAEKDSKSIAGFIDLAAPKSKGGLAANDDPSSLATDIRRTPDDKVHAKAEVLADAILRAEYKESKEQKA